MASKIETNKKLDRYANQYNGENIDENIVEFFCDDCFDLNIRERRYSGNTSSRTVQEYLQSEGLLPK